MKSIKFLVLITTLLISSLWSLPSFGMENVKKNADNNENITCQDCKKFGGLNNLKIFPFGDNKAIIGKKSNLTKYLVRSSPISQDMANLSYLKENKGKEVVFWFTLFEF